MTEIYANHLSLQDYISGPSFLPMPIYFPPDSLLADHIWKASVNWEVPAPKEYYTNLPNVPEDVWPSSNAHNGALERWQEVSNGQGVDHLSAADPLFRQGWNQHASSATYAVRTEKNTRLFRYRQFDYQSASMSKHTLGNSIDTLVERSRVQRKIFRRKVLTKSFIKERSTAHKWLGATYLEKPSSPPLWLATLSHLRILHTVGRCRFLYVDLIYLQTKILSGWTRWLETSSSVFASLSP